MPIIRRQNEHVGGLSGHARAARQSASLEAHATARDKLRPMLKAAWMVAAGLALAQAPEFQPVGTMSQLMIHVIYPSSDAIFYVDRNPPANDADWKTLEKQALILAESGNLLLMPGRVKEKGNWIKDSKMMIDAGIAAFKAAQAKDIEAVRAVNDALYASCVTCHAEYRKDYGKPKK